MMAAERTSVLTLGDLFPGITHPGLRRREVLDVTLSSQDVRPGSVFFALPGKRRHGLAYAEDALHAGATAVVYDSTYDDTPTPPANQAALIGVPGLHEKLGSIADYFFGEPSRALCIAGITGTNGKTTCTHMIASALAALDRRAGMIGTIGFGLPGALEPTAFTTPDVFTVHRHLANFRVRRLRYVAMEVSSHALTQRRVDGVRFDSALFTNLTRDHLDYHGDLAHYEAAKASLFKWPGLRQAIINVDDAAGRRILATLDGSVSSISVQLGETDLPRGSSVVQATVRPGKELVVDIDGSFGRATIESRLIGQFNASNLAIAFAQLAAWDIAPGDAASALAAIDAAPGRLEHFGGGQHADVYVDYAHTPDALRVALEVCRARADQNVTVVFGCGGERDQGKRAQMGEIAASLADRVILTDDNPRGENPEAIVRGILDGIANRSHVDVERDRSKAIRAAIESAQAGDVVLIAGKGHEATQTTGRTVRPFSDRDIVSDVLESKA